MAFARTVGRCVAAAVPPDVPRVLYICFAGSPHPSDECGCVQIVLYAKVPWCYEMLLHEASTV